jgi:hypothetical protein
LLQASASFFTIQSKDSSMRSLIFTCASIAFFLSQAGHGNADMVDMVCPPGFIATAGNSQGTSPLRPSGTGGSRVQQLFESIYFGKEPLTISSISFRAYNNPARDEVRGSFNASEVNVQLSTTQAGDESSSGQRLSTSFATNIGSDVQTVFSGPLSLSSDTVTKADGTNEFDYTINFKAPFYYDPSQGNLLLDVNVPANAMAVGSPRLLFDSVNVAGDGIASIINRNNGAATTGLYSTSGAIASFQTQASVIPEPSSLSIVGAALIGLALIRGRRS